jgi:transcriptional regulator of acetoin/glycerol metabolism
MEGTETTVREVTCAPPRKEGLSLCWVWPDCRVDSLQGSRLGIGRDKAAKIRLEGSGVSRHHAELYRQGRLWVVRDLASTNGTWLGGRRIEHAPVVAGNVLRVGECVGVFVSWRADACPFSELAPGLFGGPEIAGLVESLRRGAASDMPVLLIGRTGTGKERFARAVHHFSGRKGPFVAINCAALPEQLSEAELFGYRRGAFTGADRASGGHFRAAHLGTLFLDEMPELTAALQAKLLRVIEDKLVMGLGESQPVQVDVRIVSASQRPLSELVARGSLREDLAARLTGLELRLPTLALRRSDVAPLFAQVLRRQSAGALPAVEARLIEALCLHAWPQNVRELELAAKTLLAVHGHEPRLMRQHLPPSFAELAGDLVQPARHEPVPALRERHVHDLARLKGELKSNGGNVKAAAAALGISRQRAYRLMNGIGAVGLDNGKGDANDVGR